MAIAYLAIGSNIGDKDANCAEAVARLEKIGHVKVIARSRLYTTKAAGGPPQESYLNGVLKVSTQIEASEFLRVLKTIEKDMGRDFSKERNHPRIIDLDILIYGDIVMDSGELTIPHPRMHHRSFVLEGMIEIAPDVMHPVLGKTMEELYFEISSLAGEKPR